MSAIRLSLAALALLLVVLPSASAQSSEAGRIVVGYGYDGTHGPRLGLGIYEVPGSAHGLGLSGYGFTGTVDARFGAGPTVMQPSVGAQFWLFPVTVGAELAVPTDFTTLWVVPRLQLGAGFFGYRLMFTAALGSKFPEGMGRFGAQLEIPLTILWEANE